MDILTVMGDIQGWRDRGRSLSRWTDDIKQMTGQSLAVAFHQAEYRKNWRRETVEIGIKI